MKALWTQPTVTFKGEFWQVDGAAMEPKPWQKPYPPIWFGANHPNALRRAVRHGDGFFGAGSTTTARFAEQVPLVRAALHEAGRDPATFPIAKRIYVAIDDDRDVARRQIGEGLEKLYAQFALRNLLDVAVYGTAAECAAGVHEVMDAGAELILFTPLANEHEQMERLGAEVIPLLG
jgi:alkanesulfonate monooxygenase SsuD/methylene tetrahydromethanopterin reductase-like flavin-dependent oxidoreductase (luciferase family)